MTRAEIFEEYLTSQEQYIVYNGVAYTLLTKDNDIVTQTDTNNEMYTFIKGYYEASKIANIEIEKMKEANETLRKQNETNIKNYEKVIEDMGKPTMGEFPD